MYSASDGEIKNPGLIRAMRAMRENNTASNRSRMASALMDARLLSPVRSENLYVAAEGPTHRVKFEEISNTKGDRYYLAFTDFREYNKWNRDGRHRDAVVMDIEDYADILLRTLNEVSGFVINPFGENVSISKSLLLSLLRQRDEKEDQTS